MKITSMEITNKQFKRGIRGYNCDEVDEFLDGIAEDYERIYKENSTLKEKIANLEDKINHYSKMEDTIQNTLLLAQNSAEQAKETAQKEADLIIKNANDSAKRIIEKAQNDVMKITDEFDYTKQEFNKFRNRYKTFMKTQMDMFDEMEKEFIKNYNIGSAVSPVSSSFIKEKEIELNFDEEVKENSVDNNQFKVSDVTINKPSLENDEKNIKSFFVKED